MGIKLAPKKRKPGRPVKKHAGGRPTLMTPETIQKLERAYMMGCGDLEACIVANIAKSTLYNYQANNPEFVDRKEQLKKHPTLKARATINKHLDKPDTAKWYLEHKEKKEFSKHQSQDIDLTADVEIEICYDETED